MVCLMEQQTIGGTNTIITQGKAYFQSQTYINLEATNIKKMLFGMIYEILEGIINYYQKKWFWLIF